MLETLLNLFENYKKTCSIVKPRSKCVTFARSGEYLKYLSGVKKDMWVMLSDDLIDGGFEQYKHLYDPKIKFYFTTHPEYEFTLFHNEINKDRKKYQIAQISQNCKLNETVLLGVEGLKVVNAPDGSKVQFTHTGMVEIEEDVEIGPYSVVHRGTMDNTIIRKGCRFGAFTNIGHNCDVGENTVMAAGVILNGGVKVGKNCWFASGSLIRHYVNICENVVIGLEAVVVKDITEPGIYVGNPARYLKPIEEGWNF